jgi:hypothetical protein
MHRAARARFSGGRSGDDPGRAPTGVITDPGDLLKEADGTEFRFDISPLSIGCACLSCKKHPPSRVGSCAQAQRR